MMYTVTRVVIPTRITPYRCKYCQIKTDRLLFKHIFIVSFYLQCAGLQSKKKNKNCVTLQILTDCTPMHCMYRQTNRYTDRHTDTNTNTNAKFLNGPLSTNGNEDDLQEILSVMFSLISGRAHNEARQNANYISPWCLSAIVC